MHNGWAVTHWEEQDAENDREVKELEELLLRKRAHRDQWKGLGPGLKKDFDDSQDERAREIDALNEAHRELTYVRFFFKFLRTISQN